MKLGISVCYQYYSDGKKPCYFGQSNLHLFSLTNGAVLYISDELAHQEISLCGITNAVTQTCKKSKLCFMSVLYTYYPTSQMLMASVHSVIRLPNSLSHMEEYMAGHMGVNGVY
jgi:hypothetical protein